MKSYFSTIITFYYNKLKSLKVAQKHGCACGVVYEV